MFQEREKHGTLPAEKMAYWTKRTWKMQLPTLRAVAKTDWRRRNAIQAKSCLQCDSPLEELVIRPALISSLAEGYARYGWRRSKIIPDLHGWQLHVTKSHVLASRVIHLHSTAKVQSYWEG